MNRLDVERAPEPAAVDLVVAQQNVEHIDRRFRRDDHVELSAGGCQWAVHLIDACVAVNDAVARAVDVVAEDVAAVREAAERTPRIRDVALVYTLHPKLKS